MITEDYVSFEVARLLKEKGFPQEYDIYHSLVYNEEDYEDEYEVQRMVLETKLVKAGTLSSYPIGVPEPKCYCPTQAMTLKWLREVYNIMVSPYALSLGYYFEIFDLTNRDITGCKPLYKVGIPNKEDVLNTYEQACEAAIKYCLENLI